MTKRNLFRIAVLVAVAGYFACTHLLKPGPVGGAAKHAALSAPIPANAREFTLGSMTFKSCELAQKGSGATTAAFCTPFTVAENRDEPSFLK